MAVLSAERTLEGLAGAVLVAVVLSDVFRSVILPRATRQSLQLGPVLGAMMLRLWLRWARRQGPKRALGAFGPLLLVTEMLAWVVLLILGYSMLLHATGGLQPRDTFGDALYASASVFVTTGLSGQEAATGPARVVVAVAGFSGLAVVTLTVTFLLSIQTDALLRREALVLRLRARVGPNPTGLKLLETLSRMGRPGDAGLTDFFSQWEGWAADVLLTHRAFPILVYFRSTDEDCGWMAALGAVLDAAALVAITGHEDAGEHAQVCHRMGARLIADLARQFGIQARLEAGLDRAAFDSGLERLQRAGYPETMYSDLAWQRFESLRSQHLPPLRAMTSRFGEAGAEW